MKHQTCEDGAAAAATCPDGHCTWRAPSPQVHPSSIDPSLTRPQRSPVKLLWLLSSQQQPQQLYPGGKSPCRWGCTRMMKGTCQCSSSCVVNSAVTLPLPTNTENISNRFAFLLWVMGDLTPYQILPLEIRFYSHTQEKIKKENVSKGPFIKDLFAAWKTYP